MYRWLLLNRRKTLMTFTWFSSKNSPSVRTSTQWYNHICTIVIVTIIIENIIVDGDTLPSCRRVWWLNRGWKKGWTEAGNRLNKRLRSTVRIWIQHGNMLLIGFISQDFSVMIKLNIPVPHSILKFGYFIIQRICLFVECRCGDFHRLWWAYAIRNFQKLRGFYSKQENSVASAVFGHPTIPSFWHLHSIRGWPLQSHSENAYVSCYKITPNAAEFSGIEITSEPVLLNAYGAPELIPGNEFRQPM